MTLGAATTGPGCHRAVFRWWRSAGARYLAGGGPGRGFRAWTKYGSQRMPARSLDETEIFLEARLRVAAGRSGAGVACGSAECLARGGRVGRTQALQSTGFAAGPSAIRKRPAQLGKEVEAFERQLRRHHPPHFASVRFLGPESCSHSACRGITSSLQQACDVGLPNCPTSRLQMYKVFIVLLLVLGGCRVLPQPLRTLLQGWRREGSGECSPG